MPHRLTPQTLRRLTYFAAIADAGSIREAARRLGLSVAVVSESLSELEAELEATLATRSTRRLSLTNEGRRVQAVADEMLNAASALYSDQGAQTNLSGRIAITAPVEIAQVWLPSRLKHFSKRHPDVDISVSANDHMVDLRQSDFDVAIRGIYLAPGSQRPKAPHMALTCVSNEPWQLQFEKGPNIAVAKPLIAKQSERNIGFVDLENRSEGSLTFSDTLQLDNKQVALAMVQQGLGVALVTRSVAETYSDLHMLPATLDFGVVALETVLRDKHPSRVAKAFIASLDTTSREERG